MPRTRASGSAKRSERFSTIQGPRVPRSAFDRSHSHKTTLDSGFLIPIYVDEILPGDTVHIQTALFARMSTPFKPFMDGIHIDHQWFFTPLRLLWDNFVRMMGERPDPADHNDYTVPQMVAPGGGHLVGSLSDYLTIPTEAGGITHSTLYHRNYNLVWREWYRDENLQDAPVVDVDDGPDDHTDYVLLRRGKRKDYFSGALPFSQKGTAVSLPLGATAPVTGTGLITASGQPTFTLNSIGGHKMQNDNGNADMIWDSAPGGGINTASWDDPQLDLDNNTLVADLSSAVSATINDMRVAITMQHLLERDARGGTRYREQVLAHFGVQTDDIRLLRPELLATGSTPVQVNPISQTAVSTAAARVGTFGANATAAGVARGFLKSFTEHGILMCLVSIRAELTYQQGLNRMFSRQTRFDYYWPDFASLGEQAVISREIFMDGNGVEVDQTGDFSIWGYQPRYEEYRHRTSMITGQFRSTFAQSLDVWHLGLDFATRPVLNAAFIEENPPIARVISVVDPEPEFLLDSFFRVRHVRPMPRYSTPGLARF